MGIRYNSLDANVRQWMLHELDLDKGNGRLYISPRLTEDGANAWPELLRNAFLEYNDDWLSSQIRSRGFVRETEQRKKPNGGFTTARVPHTAPETLAEGEFNRFYARGLCAAVLAGGGIDVEVCRGKEVENPRPESQAMIGRRLPAQQFLKDLRESQGVEPALGLPRPNSGLTIWVAR